MTFIGKPATNDLVVWDGTKFVQTPNVVLNQNASPGPSAANTGRIHFDTTNQQVMISENGSSVHSIGLVHPTIADLRARTPQANSNVHAMVNGYSTAGDGGGGLFTWVTTGSPLADNGGTIITPTGTPGGYWKRIMTGQGTNVKWFGAKGDNTTDDITAITNAIAAVRVQGILGLGGGTVYFPNGIYVVSSPVLLYDGIKLTGDNPGTINGNCAFISARSNFSGDAVVRSATRGLGGVYGCAVTNLGIGITSHNNVVCLDMSGLRAAEISGVLVGAGGSVGTNTTGILYSSLDGATENAATTFFNIFNNISIINCAIGIRIHCGSNGTASDCQFNIFFITGCVVSIQLESTSVSLGVTFINGYVFSPFNTLVKYVGDAQRFLDCVFINVEFDSAGNPNPSPGIAIGSMVGLLGIPEPSAAFVAHDSMVAHRSIRYIVANNDLNGAGLSSFIPLSPNAPRGCQSMSFWAMIPRGTSLVPGANTFLYHTEVGIDTGDVSTNYYGLRDMFFKFNVTQDGGLNSPYSFSCSNSKTIPSWDGVNGWNTYTVKLYLDGYNTLTSDMVFFLEAFQTAYTGNTIRIGNGFEETSSPTVSGIVYDWNADSAANTGGVMTSWTDSVSNVVLTPPTTPSRPTYLTNQINGHNAVQGDGATMYATSTSFVQGLPFEYWLVMKQVSPYINGGVIVNDASLDRCMVWTRGGSPAIQLYSNGGLFEDTNSGLPLDTWGIVRVRFVGPMSEIQVGSNASVRDGTDPGSLGIANGITIFKRNTSAPGNFSHIALARLLIVDLTKGNYNPDALLASLKTTYAL